MNKYFPALVVLFYVFTTTSQLHSQWVQTSAPRGNFIRRLAANGSGIFASMRDNSVSRDSVFYSPNNGTSWTAIHTGLPPVVSVYGFAFSGPYVFAGTVGTTVSSGVYRSDNNGANWFAFVTNADVRCFAASGAIVWAGTENSIFLSTDNGENWSFQNTGLTNSFINALVISGPYIFAGPSGLGVYSNGSAGGIWNRTTLQNTTVFSLAASGTNIFAASYVNGSYIVYRSNDYGTSWTALNIGLPTTSVVYSIAVSGTTIFASTSSGVLRSIDNGTSWTAVNTGLTNLSVITLAVNGSYLFAGTQGAGIWRRPLSEMLASVESSIMPMHFSLDQNYPNPFNPTTTIAFAVPSKSFVSLKVFDALGREVSSLLAEELSPGNYSQQWNAEGLASGVYYYRLQAGSFVETKKLLLLR